MSSNRRSERGDRMRAIAARKDLTPEQAIQEMSKEFNIITDSVEFMKRPAGDATPLATALASYDPSNIGDL